MAATSIDGLALNIMNYSGLNFRDAEEDAIYLMNLAEEFKAEYDMYDESMRAEILAMQSPDLKAYVNTPINEEEAAYLYSYV
jgi:hypothetical protein